MVDNVDRQSAAMTLTLVITCYNEAPYLQASFSRIRDILLAVESGYEIIFVDDHSTDNTRTVIEQIIRENPGMNFQTIFHQKNMGRGRSVSDGFQLAKGDVVGFLDVDLEVGAQYIPPAVSMIRSGEADFVMARRIYAFSLRGISRALLSRGYNLLVRLVLRLPFSDTEAGFKFFNRVKILPVLDRLEDQRWFWDTEIVARSYWAGLKIKLLPAVFTRNPEKKSTVRIFRDSFLYLGSLLIFRKKFGKEIRGEKFQNRVK